MPLSADDQRRVDAASTGAEAPAGWQRDVVEELLALRR
jgi:hypothetical protein